MAELKVGIQLASLRLPFKKALHIAGDLQADGVEIDARSQVPPRELTRTGLRQVRKLMDDRNLRVAAVGFRTRRGYHVLEGLDRRVEATKEALQMAYQLGAAVVVNHLGPIPEKEDDPDWQLLLQVLTDLGRFGQRTGATLAAETAGDPTRLAKLIKALPEGCLAVNLDPGNLVGQGFSATEAAQLLGKDVLHVHAKDAARDLGQGRAVETPLGRGTVDFPSLIGTLEEHGYRGYFTIKREFSPDPVTEIGHAVEYLRNL